MQRRTTDPTTDTRSPSNNGSPLSFWRPKGRPIVKRPAFNSHYVLGRP